MFEGCRKLPCGHIFHIDCLKAWFVQQQTCPTCRADVMSTPRNQQPSTIRETVGHVEETVIQEASPMSSGQNAGYTHEVALADHGGTKSSTSTEKPLQSRPEIKLGLMKRVLNHIAPGLVANDAEVEDMRWKGDEKEKPKAKGFLDLMFPGMKFGKQKLKTYTKKGSDAKGQDCRREKHKSCCCHHYCRRCEWTRSNSKTAPSFQQERRKVVKSDRRSVLGKERETLRYNMHASRIKRNRCEKEAEDWSQVNNLSHDIKIAQHMVSRTSNLWKSFNCGTTFRAERIFPTTGINVVRSSWRIRSHFNPRSARYWNHLGSSW